MTEASSAPQGLAAAFGAVLKFNAEAALRFRLRTSYGPSRDPKQERDDAMWLSDCIVKMLPIATALSTSNWAAVESEARHLAERYEACLAFSQPGEKGDRADTFRREAEQGFDLRTGIVALERLAEIAGGHSK